MSQRKNTNRQMDWITFEQIHPNSNFRLRRAPPQEKDEPPAEQTEAEKAMLVNFHFCYRKKWRRTAKGENASYVPRMQPAKTN